jgi:MFS family permease
MTSIVASRAGAHQRGAVLGVQQAAGGLARVVGPVAGGLLFEHLGVPAPYVTGAVIMVVAALVAAAAAAPSDASLRPDLPTAP